MIVNTSRCIGRTLILMLTAVLVTGCSLELLASTAVQSELQAQNAKSAMKQLDHAERMADKIEIRQALQVYRVENGAYPESLHDLVPRYLHEVPVGPDGTDLYAYDPVTGWFGLPSEQPTQPLTEADQANMELIMLALDEYYLDYNKFPNKLNRLVPDYLVTVPVTESGKPFEYVAQSGIVMAPRGPAGAQRSPQTSQQPAITNQHDNQINQVMDDLGI